MFNSKDFDLNEEYQNRTHLEAQNRQLAQETNTNSQGIQLSIKPIIALITFIVIFANSGII